MIPGTEVRRSLYPAFSSRWKHLKLVVLIAATRASCAGGRGNDAFLPEVRRADLAGSARYHLLGGEDTVLDQASDAMTGDFERRRGFKHCEPFARFFGATVGMNSVYAPQRTDTMRSPGLALTCRHAHPVQRCCDILI